MPNETRVVAPGPRPGQVRTAAGQVLTTPADWVLVPPGDAALTRRVKAGGPTWSMQEKRGRKVFSQGIWAPAARVEKIRAALVVERAQPQYAKRLAADAGRRAQKQAVYVDTFYQAVFDFLAFAPCYAALAERLAHAVTAHATPVGSGTVARTERIPVEQRGEAAVIAWLRHQTTAYDSLKIPRVKGQRREVRRQLAAASHRLLDAYRRGAALDATRCPLQIALAAPPEKVN